MNKLVYALIGLSNVGALCPMYHGPDGYHNRHQRMSSAPVSIPSAVNSSKKELLMTVSDSLTQALTKHSPESRVTVITQLGTITRELRKLEKPHTRS